MTPPSLLLVLACTGDPPVTDTTVTDTIDTATRTSTAPGPLLRFAGDRPQNVLMIPIDTLRRDRVGAGYDRLHQGRDVTPFMDRLMAEGVVLDDHRSCSNWTYSSVACVLGGQSSVDLGWLPDLTYGGAFESPPESIRFLGEELTDRGVESWIVNSSRFLCADKGITDGYTHHPYACEQIASSSAGEIREATEAILDAVDAADRWFLHLHVKDPHSPYVPSPNYATELQTLEPITWDLTSESGLDALENAWDRLDAAEQALVLDHLRVRYDGLTQYMDDQLALLWNTLDQRGMLDDTLVVFWTDHGEQFFERGHVRHADRLGPEENDALAFFWAKDLAPAVWTGPTQHADIAPTLMSALELDPVASYTGVVAGDAPPDRVQFTAMTQMGAPTFTRQAVILDGWKLEVRWDGGVCALYDRNTDRDELQNLLMLPEHAERVQQLWALLGPELARILEMKTADWDERFGAGAWEVSSDPCELGG